MDVQTAQVLPWRGHKLSLFERVRKQLVRNGIEHTELLGERREGAAWSAEWLLSSENFDARQALYESVQLLRDDSARLVLVLLYLLEERPGLRAHVQWSDEGLSIERLAAIVCGSVNKSLDLARGCRRSLLFEAGLVTERRGSWRLTEGVARTLAGVSPLGKGRWLGLIYR